MPSISDLQKRTAQAIVNIFETGRVRGEYGQVTVLAGDPGHLTYGRSQTTLSSGNLHLLIKAYCDAPGASLAAALRPYLDRLEARDFTLDNDAGLRSVLRQAGDDPVMQSEQDAFFDRVYWEPALKSADAIRATLPLAASIVYDSRIHGSWIPMRDRTNQRFGTLAERGEQAWLAQYVATRRDWLGTHSNALLRKTVYRMDSFNTLISDGKWSLPLPITVRGQSITRETLDGEPVVRASAAAPDEVTLRLTQPRTTGDGVRMLQEALARNGIAVRVDGEFGPATDAAVRELQRRKGLKVDGVVGPATWTALAP